MWPLCARAAPGWLFHYLQSSRHSYMTGVIISILDKGKLRSRDSGSHWPMVTQQVGDTAGSWTQVCLTPKRMLLPIYCDASGLALKLQASVMLLSTSYSTYSTYKGLMYCLHFTSLSVQSNLLLQALVPTTAVQPQFSRSPMTSILPVQW